MVAKKMIIRLMEEILGEYILNISKENLKVAVVRGKLKLENVQLDGDLIGSHVLSTVGLSGFAVLSCTAEKLRATIPWSRLEKEPTTFELIGLQLICVPLLPSNASRVFGAGTKLDPKCTLKTRVKRSALARFERNFFSFRIPGEGPKRPVRQRRRSRSRRRDINVGEANDESSIGQGTTYSMYSQDENSVADKRVDENERSAWRDQLVEKLFRNIEIAIRNVHVRCEVCEGALDVGQQNFGLSDTQDFRDSDKSSFAFGFKVDSLFYKSANSQFQTGKNVDWEADKRASKQKKADELEKKYKVLQTQNIAMYWDENPLLLLSECPILGYTDQNLSPHKVLSRIRMAMDKMNKYQDPGEEIRDLLHLCEPSKIPRGQPKKEHTYILRDLDLEVRLVFTMTDNGSATKCSAEVVPCHLNFDFNPQQLRQRRLLEYTMIAQRRLDTMLHQRPKRRPTEDPRAWWKYVISCVVSCPNRRPWRDVKRIIDKRPQYIALVEKKHLDCGLNEHDSARLLSLEEELPIETLLSFHLLALRNVIEARENLELSPRRQRPRRSRSRQRRGQQHDDDGSYVSTFDSDSVVSSRSILSMSRSPMRRKRRGGSRSSTRLSSDKEELSITTDLDKIMLEGGRPITDPREKLSPTKSPLPKNPALGHNYRSPSKARQPPRSYDEISYANSEGSHGTFGLEYANYTNVEDPSFDFDGVVFPEDTIEEVKTPPMKKMIRGHALSITATLLDRENKTPVIRANIQASFWARSILSDGTSLLFDLKNIDVIDCNNSTGPKLFTFDLPQKVKNREGTPLESEPSEDETSEITLPKELIAFKSFDDDLLLDSFCSRMLQEDMPLPPSGVVCRVLLDFCASGRSISLSAHAATLIWNTRCIRAFMESFFPSRSLEARTILGTQLRNAATPLVHRTQVAWTSPRSMSMKIDIDAPKLFFPVSQVPSDGALFVDSGRLSMSLKKPESESNVHLVVDSTGIHAKFRRDTGRTLFSDTNGPPHSHPEDIPIILPFEFHAEVDHCGDGPAIQQKKKNGIEYHVSKHMSMSFSAISINLVDVEVLALAIGKWYSAELLLVKRRIEQQSQLRRQNMELRSTYIERMTEEVLNIKVERVELYLQGQQQERLDKRSESKRTYMVQIMQIEGNHCSHDDSRISEIGFRDVRIVQRQTLWKAQSNRPAIDDIHHEVLVCERALNREGNKPLDDYAVKVTFMHDNLKHFDDFDVSLGSLVVRLTPTTLTHCSIAIDRIIESMKIMTKEMERRAHVAGRKARFCEARDKILDGKIKRVLTNETEDSIFVGKIAIREATVLAKCDDPMVMDKDSKTYDDSHSIVQMSFSVIVMFQSTENHDASGKKVFHMSLDNFWLCTNDELIPRQLDNEAILSPFAAEIRAVNSTVNYGEVVSNEYCLDCDSIEICLQNVQLKFITHTLITFFELVRNLRLKGETQKNEPNTLDLTRSRKFQGVATIMSFQLEPWMFVLLRSTGKQMIAPPLLRLEGSAVGNFEGCMCALSGEVKNDLSLHFFSDILSDWVHIIEGVSMSIGVEYETNDLILDATFQQQICVNATSEVIKRLSSEFGDKNQDATDSSTAFHRRHSQETTQHVKITNDSGIDLMVSPTIKSRRETCSSNDTQSRSSKALFLGSGTDITIEADKNSTLALSVASNAKNILGEYQKLKNLPVTSSDGEQNSRHDLIPTRRDDSKTPLNMEPVIEYCVQNQRLRSAFNDVSALDDGADLLSAQIWSPSDQIFTRGHGNHWLHPYLDGDVHEWSDMSGSLPLGKDEAMLPDSRWMWANDWEIDVSGEYGIDIDADGFSYAEDFSKFKRWNRRFFKPGDTCRRRRWIRMRLTKAQLSEKTPNPIPLVWRLSQCDDYTHVRITSHITIKNETNRALFCFGHKLSWQSHRLVGHLSPNDECVVPSNLSSMTHLALAVKKEDGSFNLSDRITVIPTSFSCRRRLRAEIYLDTLNDSEEFLTSNSLHFHISMVCVSGVIEITILPVLKIANMLPCSLKYRLLEAARQSDFSGTSSLRTTEEFRRTDEGTIAVGGNCSSLSVDPSLNPSIAFQVPGYQWSSYQRIINRINAESSWKPAQIDEDQRFKANESRDGKSGGYSSTIHFNSISKDGDPLTIVLEVISGHVPTLKLYAQYWIVDLSGFRLRFRNGSSDLLGKTLVSSKDRRSYSNAYFGTEEDSTGHEWTIGKDGMTMYHSATEQIAVMVDFYKGDKVGRSERMIKSTWSKLLDVSHKTMPKTVFSVDEVSSKRRYDFSYDVSTGPSIFSQTKIIRIFSRFHVINLSSGALYLRQQGSANAITFVPPNGTVPFHWEDSSLFPNINLSTNCVNWTKGSVNLEKVGVSSIKLDTISPVPAVLQVEVRLVPKESNGAVDVLIWNPNELQPIYTLKNLSSSTIRCRQRQQKEERDVSDNINGEEDSDSDNDSFNILASVLPGCNVTSQASGVTDFVATGLDCSFMTNQESFCDDISEWSLQKNDTIHFGFDDPQKPHVLEWGIQGTKNNERGAVEIDTIGSSSRVTASNGLEISCIVRATDSAKVIEFSDVRPNRDIIGSMLDKVSQNTSFAVCTMDEVKNEPVHRAFTAKVSIPSIAISLIENHDDDEPGQEIFLASIGHSMLRLAQNTEGYHDIELIITSIQVDNHIPRVAHPVLLSFLHHEEEPALHFSAVRQVRARNSADVFKYVAVRLLDINLALDRRTAETIARFWRPLHQSKSLKGSVGAWLLNYTSSISEEYRSSGLMSSEYKINTDRLYIEQLLLHPIRTSLTFTQEWNYHKSDPTEDFAFLQYIRMIPSISSAPITFTSFVVSHAFESPDVLKEIIRAHYSSQVTQHFFKIIGCLTILTGPADFLTNIGTGVRDFFYEPIHGLVHGPDQFWEGLETGSLSLARGVFNGVFRGAANVTGAVNSNLIALTDDTFIEERNAYHRSLTHAHHNSKPRTITDILSIAGTSVVHGVKSGAVGLVEEPLENFNRQGTAGFMRGVGHALISAVIKPVVAIGDGAILMIHHVTDATDDTAIKPIHPKRLRRALPRKYVNQRNSVMLVSYDERSSMAQQVVEQNGNHDDVYISHIYTDRYLFITSEQYLWIINRRTSEQESLRWEEISHFNMFEGLFMQVIVFTERGLKPKILECESTRILEDVHTLMSMQAHKMTNAKTWSLGNDMNDLISNGTQYNIDGIRARQANHLFGSVNCQDISLADDALDNEATIDQCLRRVGYLSGDNSSFLSSLDEEAWGLISSWRYLYSGIHSRRCLVAGLINGTGKDVQIKSTSLLEGGSPCCHIPSHGYDKLNGILKSGGAIIFFCWGVPPDLNQDGSIFLYVETNVCTLTLLDRKSPLTSAEPRHKCIFLEKSVSGWWSKYWIIIK